MHNLKNQSEDIYKPDIVEVVESVGVRFEMPWEYEIYIAQCPFHPNDEDDVLRVYQEKQTYKCTCGKHGDGRQFIRKMKTLNLL